jgi:hypothetical protein
MYLVELRPGKEELYRSSDELALAIRNGDVDARSRVYHRATAKWISITLHPQYKAIVAAAKEDPAVRSARRGWGILGGGGGQAAEPSGSDTTASNGHVLHRWRRPLALGISGLLLISGIQLAFSGPRPQWGGSGRAVTTRVKVNRAERIQKAERTEKASRSDQPELVSLVSTTMWPTNDQPITHDLTTAATREQIRRALPRAPRLRPRSLREALASSAAKKVDANSLDALFARYGAAHDSARTRLETGMRVARLSRLFAAPRLDASGGLTDTRMSLAGAANFIRVFREQQAEIEAAYQDSVTMLAKKHGWSPKKVRQWYSRPPRKEGPTLEILSGSLLATIDSVLGVLNAQAGAYKIRGTAIAFEDPMAGQTYGALRRRIKEQVDAAVAAGGATSSGPAELLLRAIGTTSLPRET